jgi:DNA-binding MarR family transcriptional regulator
MGSLTNEELKLIFHHIPLYSHTLFSADSPVFREHEGLNMTHIHAVVFLKINGQGMMSTIANFLSLEKGSFTPVANRLINWGYVVKVPDDQDKRKIFLQLTPEGLIFASRLKDEQVAIFEQAIGRLSRSEQKAFFQNLTRMNDLLMKMRGDQGGHLPGPCQHHRPAGNRSADPGNTHPNESLKRHQEVNKQDA